MKELSIEEKTKAYDEVLIVAKQLYNDSNTSKKEKYLLKGMFPELAESEDEKIRKYIIKVVHEWWVRCNDPAPDFPNEEQMLAWLEKQGELLEINPTEFDTRLQSLIGKFDSLSKKELIGSLSFWLNVVQNDGTYKDEEKQCEQKPAEWSEEDERFLNVAINILNSSKVYTKSPDKYEDTINWLKSFKERFQLQNRRKYKRIKPITAGYSRTTWKPSEAQMVVLNDIIINGHLSNANERILKGLQEQLKKLMGNSYESKH